MTEQDKTDIIKSCKKLDDLIPAFEKCELFIVSYTEQYTPKQIVELGYNIIDGADVSIMPNANGLRDKIAELFKDIVFVKKNKA